MSTSTGTEGTRDGGRNNPTGGGSRASPRSDKDIAAGRKGGDTNAGGRASSHAHSSGSGTHVPGATVGGSADAQITSKKSAAAGVSPDRYMDTVGAYAGRIRDDLDTDNSFLDNVGNALAGLLGFDEMPPEFDVNNLSKRTSWGLDPIQALASFAGLATGAPVGSLYMGAKAITGWRGPEIDMGESVVGDDDPLNQSEGVHTGANPGGGTSLGGGAPGGVAYGGGNRDKDNGLLPERYPNKPSVFPVNKPPVTTPTIPPPATKPPAGPSKYPTPSQKFQAPSYFAGDWVFNPTTQEVEWVSNAPKNNGLLAV